MEANKKQQECIDSIDGKFMVLAGPGTGKTFTIINRIKSMIEKGIEPDKILALTFSEAAASEMKNRLDNEINKLDSGVYISTYHSFCLDIIKENSEEFELPDNYKVITDTVSKKFIKECIDEIQPKAFRTEKNDPYFYLSIIYNKIQEIKKNRLSKESYFHNIKTNPDWEPELIRAKNRLEDLKNSGKKIPDSALKDIDNAQKNLDKAYELWQFYELYKSKMEKEHYIDFNDMINFVLDKFDNDSSFLKNISNKYDYILVDEYQDTNKPQNDIIMQLTKASDKQNVFVVGDDDQIIYTFQGAKLDTMERFLKEFPDTQVICLTENMRSTRQVLDIAREIAKQDDRRLEVNPEFKKYDICKDLTAKNDSFKSKEKPVRLFKYFDIVQEYNEIVEEIENLINSDECPTDKNGEKNLSEIAILAQTNGELASFAEKFKERNIPYELKDGSDIFSIKSSLVLYYYMQMLISPELHSDKIFKLLLLPPFNINSKDFETLFVQHSKYTTFIDSMRNIDKSLFINPEKIENFVMVFDYLQAYRTNEKLKNVVLEIGIKTGIFNYYLNSEVNRTANIAGLKKIVDEAVNFSDTMNSILLEDFIEYLDMAYNGDTVLKTDKAPVTQNAVQLVTYHSSKGREFEYVYMPSLIREKWESASKSYKSIIPLDKAEYKNSDELKDVKFSDNVKTMFVGMTRAKHTLRLSYPQKVNGKDKKPSKLILNIQDLCNQQSMPEYSVESFWMEQSKDLIKRDYDYTSEFNNLVKAKLCGKSFSPTVINTYLNCPRQYFYHYILDFAAKDGNADAMHYGTSVHEACENAVTYALKNKSYPTKDEFIKTFKRRLSTLPISTFEARMVLDGRGEAALDKYYTQLCSTPISNLYDVEYRLEFEMDDIKFKGFIDRIDKNEDGTYSIYDYKTGTAKKENVITPGGEHEDYYNQIGLYKYYFEKATGFKVKNTTFIFPEDFTKNLTLNLTEEECEEIDKKFRKAIENIRSYKFDPLPKLERVEEKCKYCQYKDFCNLEIV